MNVTASPFTVGCAVSSGAENGCSSANDAVAAVSASVAPTAVQARVRVHFQDARSRAEYSRVTHTMPANATTPVAPSRPERPTPNGSHRAAPR